jgi:hypothetical protein
MANATHSPQALPFAKANGKCIRHLPFANSLQRIGKHTAFATGECIGFADFTAKANGK